MELIEAAKSGEAEKLARLLGAAGRNLEACDEGGRTAAYWAAREGHAECLERLAKAGANLTARNVHGLSPAEAARICGREAALAVLAEREGPWIFEEGGRGRWVAQALAEGRLGCAHVLLEACAKERGPDGHAREAADAARSLSRMTEGAGLDWDGAWRWLEARGGLSWIRSEKGLMDNPLLFSQMAMGGGKEPEGLEALASAMNEMARSGNPEGMRALLKLDVEKGELLAEALRAIHGGKGAALGLYLGTSVLCEAAQGKGARAWEACEVAIEVLGPRCLVRAGYGGKLYVAMEPARCAALAGNVQLAERLDGLEPVLFGAASPHGRSLALKVEEKFVGEMWRKAPDALWQLLAKAKLPVQKWGADDLAEKAARMGRMDWLGQALALRPKRSLWAAARGVKSDRELVALALKASGAIGANAAGADGAADLLSSARKGDAKRVGRLLAAGADANAVGERRETALMAAVESGSEECVGLLLGKGARTGERDSEGWTAAMRAARRGHLGCLEALVDAGASLGENDGDGVACVALAKESGNEKLAAWAESWELGQELKASGIEPPRALRGLRM